MKITRRLTSGQVTEEIITVDIKAGWKSGTKIKFAGKGDELPGGGCQDVEFVLEQKTHGSYTRIGDDLHVSITLTLVEALAGFSKVLSSLDGRSISIQGANSSDVVADGDTLVVKGEGMPMSKFFGRKGDLQAKVHIKFPKSLTISQKESLRMILGGT